MAPRDPQAVLQKLGQTTLKIDSFFLRRTGFIANQTVLKLGDYNLNCIPATLSAETATFLAVLTATEVSLFSRFKEGTHILILTFDNRDNKDIARFPLRVGLQDIQPVPDRKNVCFVTLRLKSLPGELLLFLGTYLDELEQRLAAWETLSEVTLAYQTDGVVPAGLGYGAVLCAGETRCSVEITEFHTKRIGLRLPAEAPALPEGTRPQLRLVYQSRPVVLDGVYEPGVAFLPEFNPDWLDFVEEVRFQQQLKARNGPGKAP